MKKNGKILVLVIALAVVVVLIAALIPKLMKDEQAKEAVTEAPAAPAEEQAAASETETEAVLPTATDFTVYDTEGNAVRLSDRVGKPCIVNFWATWCRYCVEELPTFDKYCAEYGDRIDFMMVDLPDGSYETEEGALAFAAQEGYSFPVYFDSDYSASEAYEITGIPMTLIVDENGGLVQNHVGLMDEATLKGYIDELLK